MEKMRLNKKEKVALKHAQLRLKHLCIKNNISYSRELFSEIAEIILRDSLWGRRMITVDSAFNYLLEERDKILNLMRPTKVVGICVEKKR